MTAGLRQKCTDEPKTSCYDKEQRMVRTRQNATGLTLLTCTLKNGEDAEFCVCFTTTKKKEAWEPARSSCHWLNFRQLEHQNK